MSTFEYKKLRKIIASAIENGSFTPGFEVIDPETGLLEQRLRQLYNADYALCVDSATNAMLYVLLACGLRGEAIVASNFTWGQTLSGALVLSCPIHLADIDGSLNLNPMSLNKIVQTHPGVKAVIATDICGIPHNIKAVESICRKYGVFHIVDAAQSMGCDYSVPDPLNYCDALVVSFGQCKTISCCGGGAIITNNKELYNQLLLTCMHPHRQHIEVGGSYATQFSLNGRIHPLVSFMANQLWEAGLDRLSQRKDYWIPVYRKLAEFSSVEPVSRIENGTFYNVPFIVKNWRIFLSQFHGDNIGLYKDFLYERGINLRPISRQMDIPDSDVDTPNLFKLLKYQPQQPTKLFRLYPYGN